MILVGLLVVLILTYVLLIGSFILGYGKVKTATIKFAAPSTAFSIVIPFRNEAENLPALLDSLSHLQYPKELFEVFLVNDDSFDASLAIIEKMSQDHPHLKPKVLENKRRSLSPKKDAVHTAIDQATHEWILTTDADCILPKEWLLHFDSCVQEHQPEIMAGPISLRRTPTSRPWLFAFELLDIASLLGATIGSFGLQNPIMANGANLAYTKSGFYELDGFEGNNHRASGDDVFLLEKFQKHKPEKVRYLKAEKACVQTRSQYNWSQFLSQRKRWASKASGYTNPFAKAVGLIVLAANLSIIAISLLLLVNVFPIHPTGTDDSGLFTSHWPSLKTHLFLGLLFLKIAVDGILIFKSLRFMKRGAFFKWYPVVALFYPYITVFVALSSLSRSFTWKGRNYQE